MPKEVDLSRIEFSDEGEIIGDPQARDVAVATSPHRRFPSPLRALRDRQARKELERKAEAEAQQKLREETEFRERIETILIKPIRKKLNATFQTKISEIFKQHELYHVHLNAGFLYTSDFESFRDWTTELRLKIGPKFLCAINGLFLPGETEIPKNILSDDQIASSSLLTTIIKQQQDHLIEMGYPEELSELGVSSEEILQELQGHAITMYHRYIEQLNQHYFCAYGEYKDKRKRS